MISNSSIDGPVWTYAAATFLDFLNGNYMGLIVLIVWIAGFAYTQYDMKKERAARVAASEADAE